MLRVARCVSTRMASLCVMLEGETPPGCARAVALVGLRFAREGLRCAHDAIEQRVATHAQDDDVISRSSAGRA